MLGTFLAALSEVPPGVAAFIAEQMEVEGVSRTAADRV